VIDGNVRVCYPRYLSIPKLATWLQGLSMARSVRSELRSRWADWRPDIIDAHFAFPEGYAAARLAQDFGIPVVITCHGSDLHLYPTMAFVGKMMRWEFGKADRVISVSDQLRRASRQLGCPTLKGCSKRCSISAWSMTSCSLVDARIRKSLCGWARRIGCWCQAFAKAGRRSISKPWLVAVPC